MRANVVRCAHLDQQKQLRLRFVFSTPPVVPLQQLLSLVSGWRLALAEIIRENKQKRRKIKVLLTHVDKGNGSLRASVRLMKYPQHTRTTVKRGFGLGVVIGPEARSEADCGLGPAARDVPLHGAGRAASGRLAVGQAEEARRCAAVLPRHGVVEDGVDGGAQVE